MNSPIIEFKNVTKRFDNRTILDRINLRIYEGDVTTIIGKSGEGKSVLLKHINGLLNPDSGDVLVDGLLVRSLRSKDLAKLRSRIGYVFQFGALFDSMDVFENIKTMVPNYSCRMDNLRAAILRPQLEVLDAQCERWNKRYRILEQGLNAIRGITCPPRDPREKYVGRSLQVSLTGQDEATIRRFLAECLQQGVDLKWFGNKEPVGSTSAYESWRYFGTPPHLANTTRILAVMCDMRIPLTFTEDDCRLILDNIKDVSATVLT